MVRMVLAALRARWAQALTVLVLAMFAVAGTAGAPWYVLAAAQSATDARVAGTPAGQRAVSVTQNVQALSGDPLGELANFRSRVEREVTVPGGQPVVSLSRFGGAVLPSGLLSLPITYREDVCAHLRISGSCPVAAGETILSRSTAETSGAAVGGTVEVRPIGAGPSLVLRVVGLYELADRGGPYWAAGSPSGGASDAGTSDPAFTPIATFHGQPILAAATLHYDVAVPDALLRGPAGDGLRSQLSRAEFRFRPDGLSLSSGVGALVDAIHRQRDTIDVGVVAGAGQLLGLCWFALFLAGRFTARDRRGDVALLKLRGATRLRMVRLVVGQGAAPVLAGVLPGAVLGYLVARWLAGPVGGGQPFLRALSLSAAASAVAVLGALVALALAELATLRAPVAALLRRVAPRRRALRLARLRGADLVDLAVVALAAAGVYQARQPDSAARPGLALLAPGLVALAVALLLARLVGYLAGSVGAAALRTGSLPTALGALQVSRRPGTDRLFALVVTAVAVLGTAATAWSAGATANANRAEVDLGAARVLTVLAGNPAQLLGAVRAADPSGHAAMAVVVNTTATRGAPATLAVDTDRLARVALWRPEYGDLGAALAALRPAAPPDIPITGSTLTVDAHADAADLYLTAAVQNRETGAASQLTVGPLHPARATYRVPLNGCADAAGSVVSGCRLVSLRVSGPTGPDGTLIQPPSGSTVTVDALGQLGPDRQVAAGPVLGDIRRWHPVLTSLGMGLTIAPRNGALALTVATARIPQGQVADLRAFAADAPVPVPAVLAGAAPAGWVAEDPVLSPFGGDAVPVRVAGTAGVLPVLGRQGVLVDLASVVRVAGTTGSLGTFQVWLTRGAPDSIVDSLRAAGLTVLGSDTVAAALDRLRREGPAAPQRFALLTATLGILLAAAALTVAATVEREPRVTELLALREQGLPGRVAGSIGYGSYAVLTILGVLAGVAAALVAHAVVDIQLPMFVDAWDTLPPPSTGQPVALLVAGLVGLVAIGAAGWAAARSLARRVSGTGRGVGSWSR